MKESNFENYDLLGILSIIKSNKIKLVVYSITFGLIFFLISLAFSNIYRTEAVVAPVNPESNLSSSLLELNTLPGLNLGLDENAPSKIIEATERLRSFAFFEVLLDGTIELKDLFAAKSWDPETNQINYDSDVFNVKTGEWVRDVDFPYKQIPSSQEAFEKFTELYSVTENEDNGFVVISVEHISPYIAKNWAEGSVVEINEIMRENDKKSALKSIAFLKEQLTNTNLAEVKDALSNLIKQQTQVLMLVESNEEYVFKTIDPPLVSELHYKPVRVFIFIFGLLVGFLLGLINAFRKN